MTIHERFGVGAGVEQASRWKSGNPEKFSHNNVHHTGVPLSKPPEEILPPLTPREAGITEEHAWHFGALTDARRAAKKAREKKEPTTTEARTQGGDNK